MDRPQVRAVLWPTRDRDTADTADTSLTDAKPDELRFFAEHYAGVPLADLLRRLRRAEWNAAYYQEELKAAQKRQAALPSLHVIQEVDARHKRIKALLAGGGRISRALLTAALAESDDVWNERLTGSSAVEAAS